MKLLDVVTSPWAIVPDKLIEIRDIYLTHLRGEKIDIAALEARLGKPLANEPRAYEVIDGVAVVALEGVIAQRANLFTRISGGTSNQLFAQDIKAAEADSSVKAIIINIDSPGGTVAGTETAAAAVRSAANSKHVVAFSDGAMASAAYWVGAAADRVLISGNTTTLGSIGVVAAHVDVSRAQEAAGVKTTEIVAGKYKRAASQYEPLSEEGRKVIQDQVDYLYAAFVDAIAQFRDVSAEKVLADMADGRLFIGKQALDAGLADGVSSLDALIADLATGRYIPRRKQQQRAGVALPSTASTGAIMDMTKEKIAAEYPQLAEAFRAEGVTAGAAAERQRIQDVEAAGLRGHEALIAKLKFDGKTTGAEARQQVVTAEHAVLAAQKTALEQDAPPAVPPASTVTGAIPPALDKDASLSVEDRCKAKWDSNATVRAEFASLGDYTAFEKANAAGKVKVLGGKK